VRAVVDDIDAALFAFVACYPLWTSLLWTGFALRFRRAAVSPTGRRSPDELQAARARFPLVSVVVPAHDEEELIAGSLEHVLALRWPTLDVIVVDDGSADGTRAAVRPYVLDGRVRLLRKRDNEGKALAIDDALRLALGEVVLILDADGAPQADVLERMVPHFARLPAVGAVTGSPRVDNASTLMGKLQAIEFASTVSILRRGHAAWGRVNTFSGLCTAVRRDAVAAAGGYRPDMITEDIAMTWALQLGGWEIVYEPGALFGMQAPERLPAWWRQRRRWSIGLGQVLRRYGRKALHPRHWRMWPVLAQDVLALLWVHAFFAALALAAVSLAAGTGLGALVPGVLAVTTAVAGLLQIVIGVRMDARYDPGIARLLWFAPLYPLAYWLLSAVVAVRGTLPGLVRSPRVETWNVPRVAREQVVS
jgi:biofilm PGA synthesis N-glycosyltransferase PgaC